MPAAPLDRIRAADATVTVLVDGKPLAHQEVTIAQRSHAFLFGCIGFDLIPYINDELNGGELGDDETRSRTGPDPEAGAPDEDRERASHRAERWLDLFNFATLPFYWGRFEPVRGEPDTRRVLAAARWFTEQGCTVKGHPLAWHTVTAPWLLDLPTPEIARAQVERIRREVSDFAGLVDMWDVINEVVIMPIFDKYDNGITRLCREVGRIPLVRMVFDAAREANPNAVLLLNDFDMSAAYECLIEGVLEAGIRIDALGLQSHMHQGYWGEEKTLAILDRFARYGLPIHFTETTILSGHLMPPEIVDLNDYQIPDWPTTPEGEERQAEEVVRHYRTLLSHPSVQAITYWGISDGGWLGAPGGLLRRDGSTKPAYAALHDLIKGEWWLPPTTVRTDDEGRLRFGGFLGGYEVTAGGRTAAIHLDKPGSAALAVDLGAATG